MSDRSGLSLISDMLILTRQMTEKLDDVDFLMDGVEKRGLLMQEFDELKKSSKEAAEEINRDKPQIDEIRSKILELDKDITAALISKRDIAKRELTDLNSQKKVLGYTNNAMSSSGSYMDFKK